MSYTVSWCKNVMQSESVKLNSKQASSKQQQQQQQQKSGNFVHEDYQDKKNEQKINNFNMIFVCDTIFMFSKVFCKAKIMPPT